MGTAPAAQPLVAEEQSLPIPCERSSARTAFERDHPADLLRIGTLCQVVFPFLNDEEADARSFEKADVAFNLMQFNLLFFCLGMQRAQRELHGKRGTLLRPEERECLLLKRARMSQTAEQRRTDGDEHHDRNDDHEGVCHEQFRL